MQSRDPARTSARESRVARRSGGDRQARRESERRRVARACGLVDSIHVAPPRRVGRMEGRNAPRRGVHRPRPSTRLRQRDQGLSTTATRGLTAVGILYGHLGVGAQAAAASGPWRNRRLGVGGILGDAVDRARAFGYLRRPSARLGAQSTSLSVYERRGRAPHLSCSREMRPHQIQCRLERGA